MELHKELNINNFNTIKDPAMRWGALYLPHKPKNRNKNGLRVVLFISCNGYYLLKSLAEFESLYPDKLNIVGVVSDDSIDPQAHISLRKRVWHHFPPDERACLYNRMINYSTELGLPCYTGAVKTDYFHNLFRTWQPDALLMLCFGQIIDKEIFDAPVMGSYNYHPSDIGKQIGLGAQPFEGTMSTGSTHSCLVIHEVTAVIDQGPIIGVSPDVNICLLDGSYPDSVLTLHEKIIAVSGWMGVELISKIIENKQKGIMGILEHMDFEAIMPQEVKQVLLEPAVNALDEKYQVPRHPLLAVLNEQLTQS